MYTGVWWFVSDFLLLFFNSPLPPPPLPAQYIKPLACSVSVDCPDSRHVCVRRRQLDACECVGLDVWNGTSCVHSLCPEASLYCACPGGYEWNGNLLGMTNARCVDIDECKIGICQRGTTCLNLPGTYHCLCPSGFAFNGSSCVNVDECSVGPHTCHGDASCLDTDGSYRCICNAGYTGTGRQCRTRKGQCFFPSALHSFIIYFPDCKSISLCPGKL